MEWTRQFGSSASDLASSVSVEGGDVHVAGYTEGDLEGTNAGNEDAFVRKYASNGDTQWTRQFGTTEPDYAMSVSVERGAVYVAGYTEGGLEGTRAGGSDAFIRKYDSNGDIEWTRQFGSPESDFVWSIGVEGRGVYSVGETEGNLKGENAGSYDAFVTILYQAASP